MRYFLLIELGFALCFAGRSFAKIESRPTYLLPTTCAELMPDAEPYIGFMEAVALGGAETDRNFSKRVLRILALRAKLNEVSERARDANPIDHLVEKALCFYREQKEPLRPVPFDDPAFTKYLKESMRELELKVEDAVYQTELERVQRRHYELQLQKNRDLVEDLRNEAETQANRSFQRLSSSAQQKIKNQ